MVDKVQIQIFYNAYDLYEFKIEKAISNGDTLELLIDMQSHLDLMGNGIRPSLDVEYHHLFRFKYEGPEIALKRNIRVLEYSFNDGKIKLNLNNKELYLVSDPEVVPNYV